ncbi:hypothetical protein G9A89_018833 [Geosiphon pyriformis]|nr:hypothetical protein G9A89_018833 [Geosiphon pyriformis]
MVHCSVMWSNVRKLEHIAQQYIALVKDPEIKVEHSIKISLPEETPAITLRKKLTKLRFWEAMNKTITTESLSIIQKTQPKPSDKHTFRFLLLTTASSTKLRIQPPTWKKHRIKSPTNLSYHYTLGNAINIASASTKQRKENLLGPYGAYFKRFKSRLSTPLRIQLPPPQPDFGITDPWEPIESEKEQEKEEEEESENQEFTYQNPITENPDIGTPNFQTQQD